MEVSVWVFQSAYKNICILTHPMLCIPIWGGLWKSFSTLRDNWHFLIEYISENSNNLQFLRVGLGHCCCAIVVVTHIILGDTPKQFWQFIVCASIDITLGKIKDFIIYSNYYAYQKHMPQIFLWSTGNKTFFFSNCQANSCYLR